MFAINPVLTIIALFMLPILTVIGMYMRPRLYNGWDRVRENMTRFNIFLAENIAGMRVIQAFTREEFNLAQFHQANDRVVTEWMSVIRLQAWFSPLVEITRSAALVIVLYVAANQLGLGGNALTVGTLVAFTAYINNLWGPISTLTNLYVVMQATLASAGKVFQLLDARQTVQDRPDAIELPRISGRVVFENVDFSYTESKRVLRDVSLTIEPGQLVALVGRSGAGKTTITYLLPRLYDVTEGGISVDGHDLRDVTQESLAEQIGIVTQESYLFHDTIRKNLMYARPDASEDEMIAAGKAASIHDFIMKLPQGYDTLVGERGYRLSGGEKQRLAIARVILKDPRILILDEATSHLDSENEAMIQAALEPLFHGRTSVVIAHRLSTILAADKILVLDEGQLVEQGTHAELLAAGGLYTMLYETQFRETAENA